MDWANVATAVVSAAVGGASVWFYQKSHRRDEARSRRDEEEAVLNAQIPGLAERVIRLVRSAPPFTEGGVVADRMWATMEIDPKLAPKLQTYLRTTHLGVEVLEMEFDPESNEITVVVHNPLSKKRYW